MSARLLYFVTEDWYFCSHRLPLAIAAREAGFDVTVVTRVRKHGAAIRAAGVALVPFEISRRSINPMRELVTVWRLYRVYRRVRPDIVHNVAMKPVLYGSLAARLAGIDGVVNALAGMGWLFTSPGARARLIKHWVRIALGRLLTSGIAIVQNPDDRDLLSRLGLPNASIRRIPGAGVDPVRFQPIPEPGGIPLVVLPARLLWDKGVGEFVQAARFLRSLSVKARFALVGDPDASNPASVSAPQLADWVRSGVVEHWGWLDDMPGVFSKAHIVCLPSYREGLPKALIEAAACGRPIVTTDVPGCREVVRAGENGLLVSQRNPLALAQALRYLIENREVRQKMGKRGREIALSEFSLHRIIDETLTVYRELMPQGLSDYDGK